MPCLHLSLLLQDTTTSDASTRSTLNTIDKMDLQQPSAVMIDLGKLPSTDGNGQEPDHGTHNKLKDAEMLELLEEMFNKDNALVQKWGK